MTVLMISSAVIAAGLWQAAETASASYLHRQSEEHDRDERRT